MDAIEHVHPSIVITVIFTLNNHHKKYCMIIVYKRCNTVIYSANYIHIRKHVYFYHSPAAEPQFLALPLFD